MSNVRGRWQILTLDDLVEDGRPICYGVLKPGEFALDGVPLVRIVDLVNDQVASGGLHRISRFLDAEFQRSKLLGGEVLVSIQGTIGRVAIAPKELSGANISRTIARIAVNRSVKAGFLSQWLRSPHGQRALADSVLGTTRDSLNIGILKRIRLAVPPISEQQNIVEILNTADEAIRLTERLIAKLELTKQGLLGDLLTRGIDELGNLRNESADPDQFCNTSLGHLPKGWAVVPIREVAESVTSGSRAWAAYYAESGALFLRIGNLTRKHINLRLAAKSFVRPPMNAELRRTAALPGDVLISITADLGIIGVVPDSFGEAYVNQHIALVRPTSRALGRWIGYFLSSQRAQAQFAMLNDAGAKAGLNLPAVGRLKIGLPRSVDERERIVAILDAHESEIVAYQASLSKLRSMKQGLMDDLLTGRVRAGVPP